MPAAPGAAAAGLSPLAAILAGLTGGAVGPRAATAAAVPLDQQAALLNLSQQPQGGGGLSPSDIGTMIAAGGLV